MTVFAIVACGGFLLGALWQRILLIDNMRSHVDRMIEERERHFVSGFHLTPDYWPERRV